MRSKWAISTSSMVSTKKGVSMRSTRQYRVGMRNTDVLNGTPWNPMSRNGVSNSTPFPEASSTKRLNSSLFLLRIMRSRCSSSISSGSIPRRTLSRALEDSITSRISWMSLTFFLPSMTSPWRWKWMSTISSLSAGWKNACLMFLNTMSTISFLEEVKRKPLVWSSRAPTVLRPLRFGLSCSSVSFALRPTLLSTRVSCVAMEARSRFSDSRDV
mmetsp:Transcript_26062/g.44839  ORF Transcript_26062/g.44839 Transcript_26062/m.44839 type:complete len:214 (+) Transcript_26062:39-680(+)